MLFFYKKYKIFTFIQADVRRIYIETKSDLNDIDIKD